MPSVFVRGKQFRGTGSKLVWRFAEELQKEFKERVEAYARHRLPELEDGGFEHAFYYGEQQVKTYITAALDAVCSTNFMQEVGVERRKGRKGKKQVWGSGAVDYWCRYGETTQTSFLLEVKHYWIRYYPDRDDDWCTVHAEGRHRHDKAVKQIDSIEDKMNFTTDNLYGLALTVLPVYVKYPEEPDSPARLDEDTLEEIGHLAMNELGGHAFGAFTLPKDLAIVDEWSDDEGVSRFENHPGVVMVWSAQKFSRK